MPIFNHYFTREQIERHANYVARKEFEARERQKAKAAPKPAPAPAEKPASSPAPKPITLADAQSLGIPEGDPFLVSIEMREKLAAGPGTNQSPASAGPPGTKPGTSPKDHLSPAVMHAAVFLSDALSDGQPHPASTLLAEATQQNISKDALLRARKAIRVRTERVRDGWIWSLPEDE